jgi:hypothetical protein
MKKLLLTLLFIIALVPFAAHALIAVDSGGGTAITEADNSTIVEVDCRGFDGLWVEGNITYQRGDTITVTYSTYKNKTGRWSDVTQADAVDSKYKKITGYMDNTTSAAPGFFLPLPRNSDKARVSITGCDNCTGTVFVGIDDTSK